MLKVGFIGLGTMGFPIAGHISQSYETAVFNRTTNKSQKWTSEFKGEVCESIKDLALKSNVIFLCLSEDKDIEEKYLKDQLISFNSKTLQNKKEKFVNLILNKKTKKFDIVGSSFSGEASLENAIGNWWSHKILQASSQISPISGSIKEQIVTFVGKEKITIYSCPTGGWVMNNRKRVERTTFLDTRSTSSSYLTSID